MGFVTMIGLVVLWLEDWWPDILSHWVVVLFLENREPKYSFMILYRCRISSHVCNVLSLKYCGYAICYHHLVSHFMNPRDYIVIIKQPYILIVENLVFTNVLYSEINCISFVNVPDQTLSLLPYYNMSTIRGSLPLKILVETSSNSLSASWAFGIVILQLERSITGVARICHVYFQLVLLLHIYLFQFVLIYFYICGLCGILYYLGFSAISCNLWGKTEPSPSIWLPLGVFVLGFGSDLPYLGSLSRSARSFLILSPLW